MQPIDTHRDSQFNATEGREQGTRCGCVSRPGDAGAADILLDDRWASGYFIRGEFVSD